MVAKQITSLGDLLDSITFSHIPREWNKVADGLAKWDSKKNGTWLADDWDSLSGDLAQDLESWVTKDMRGCINAS